MGHPRLRARLIERLERTEGVSEGSYREAIDRTVVTTGSAQLIYLVCEALLDPGDIVLVESPTYFVFLGPVETRGARAVRVAIDEQGLRIDALDRHLARIQAQGQLTASSSFTRFRSMPTRQGSAWRGSGGSLCLTWQAVVQGGERRILVLEDAAYHGLSYGVQEPRSLWSLEPTARR